MKRPLLLVLIAASCVSAQEKGNVVYQTAGSIGAVAFGGGIASRPVQGAPYSATITNESIQTLADGTRIVQTSSGTTARDSQGRTRQDTALPTIGNLSAANAPHLVFIHDPASQTSYTLNLTQKTAQKMPAPPPPPSGAPAGALSASTVAMSDGVVTMSAGEPGETPLPPPDAEPSTMATPTTRVLFQKKLIAAGDGPDVHSPDVHTEDLGSQTMEGILVNGTRTTHTIPAGQIGNDRPIAIVTEVWTSPDLKTIVYSKRSDPRMGEQTFRLTNIVRAEPSPSLFTVPADFKVVDGPQPIFYRTKQ